MKQYSGLPTKLVSNTFQETDSKENGAIEAITKLGGLKQACLRASILPHFRGRMER
jgi:hypothetical protein